MDCTVGGESVAKGKKLYSRVYLEITNICNMSCSFCHGTKRPKARMSLESFSQIAEQLRELTDYVYFHVLGEPLTHPALPCMIRRLSEMGIRSAVTTNGTLLPDRGDGLIESGVYKVNISLHSFEDGSEESFLSYVDGVINFAEKASERGILVVMRLWNEGCDGGRNEKILDILKARLPGEWIFGKRGARIRHRLHLEYGERFEWPDINACDLGDEAFCYGLGDHFGILSDGSVVPCCLDAEGDITLGNALEKPLSDILSSERAVAIREGFMRRRATERLCRRCGYSRRFSRENK